MIFIILYAIGAIAKLWTLSWIWLAVMALIDLGIGWMIDILILMAIACIIEKVKE